MILTQAELTARIRSDSPCGGYLFCGEEAYLRRAFLSLLREKLLTDPGLDTFNHVLHEGSDIDCEALVHDVETPPFFAPYKLVEWHGADCRSLKDEDFENLTELSHCLSENPDVTLVISVSPEGLDPGTLKRPSPVFKRLSQIFSAVNFEKSTEGQLINWLTRHFAHEGVRTEPSVPRALVQRAGRSMDVLAMEVGKLTAYVKAHGRDTVTVGDVELVSVSSTETDAFGLTNALLDKDPAKVFRNLQDMKARRVEPTLILGQVSRLYGDLLSIALLLREGQTPASIATALGMNQYRVDLYVKSASKRPISAMRQALRLCAAADKSAKTSFGSDLSLLLDRLIARLSAL